MPPPPDTTGLLTVGDLIERLSKLDRSAFIVAGGKLIEAVDGTVAGRLVQGYGSVGFTPHENGRVRGVYLTRHVEQSDGVWRPARL